MKSFITRSVLTVSKSPTNIKFHISRYNGLSLCSTYRRNRTALALVVNICKEGPISFYDDFKANSISSLRLKDSGVHERFGN